MEARCDDLLYYRGSYPVRVSPCPGAVGACEGQSSNASKGDTHQVGDTWGSHHLPGVVSL